MMIVSSVTTARQVVELSGAEAMRSGPVSQRGLRQQGFERPPGTVEYLLPRQPRGRSCPDLAVAGHRGDPRNVASPVPEKTEQRLTKVTRRVRQLGMTVRCGLVGEYPLVARIGRVTVRPLLLGWPLDR